MDTNIKASSTPRDVFLYLLGLITLVLSAVSFGALVYQYIDLKFPDVLRYSYSMPSVNFSLIRMALSSLVVVFPVYFWTTRTLHKDVVKEPTKRDIRVRRWLLYFTVFVAALIMIGDLITLIQSFLNGDLTTSFILKVITIFFIAGSILFYYLSELRDRSYPRKAFQAVIVGIVALVLGYGFYLAGSPQSQRLVRFDDQKVYDLSSIQNYIVYNWWQQKGTLPQTLDVLNDPISNFMVPVDPQTNRPYEYHLLSQANHSFQLCAEFNKPSDLSINNAFPPVEPKNGVVSGTWSHGIGRVCFDRTIDPSLYPVNPK